MLRSGAFKKPEIVGVEKSTKRSCWELEKYPRVVDALYESKKAIGIDIMKPLQPLENLLGLGPNISVPDADYRMPLNKKPQLFVKR